MYAGNDASAYRAKPRHGCARMGGDVTTGRINAAGAWHSDRLLRLGLRAGSQCARSLRTRMHYAADGP